MRKISLILLSIGALLALSFYWQGSVVAQDAQTEVAVGRTDLPGESPEDWGNWFFGQRVAGVSLSWWFVDELGGLPVDPIWGHSTVTLNADGTASLSDTSDFNGHPVFAGFNTPIHAVWERIGCARSD